MTPNDAKKKIHWHVRDSDGLRPEPYSSPAAARGAMQIGGNDIQGFRVVKIGLRGACPCRESSTPPLREEPSAHRPRINVAGVSVPSHRKVQTPEEGGDGNTEKASVTARRGRLPSDNGHDTPAAPADDVIEVHPTAEDWARIERQAEELQKRQTTYGHAELQHLQRMSEGEYGG